MHKFYWPLLLCISLLSLLGCSSAERERQSKQRMEYVSKLLSINIKDGMDTEQVVRFLKSLSSVYETHTGCYGNLGFSATECNGGNTITTSIKVPEKHGAGEANVYIFVHSKRGVLSHEVTVAYVK